HTNRRDLRNSLDRILRVKERMIRLQIEDRILLRRQHAGDLLHPVVPFRVAPEVVDPEEAAFQQVVTEAGYLLLGELGCSHVLHVQVRTVEEIVVGQPEREVIWLTVRATADARPGQFRETEGEVYVGVGIVRGPAGA